MSTLPPPPPGAIPSSGETEPETEVAPERRSPWHVVVAVLALVGLLTLGAGLFVWAFGGPISCAEGTFTSERFGYCVQVPQGWEVAGATDDAPVDRFQVPTASGTVLVSAVPLSGGQDLAAFEDYIRSLEEGVGRAPGPSTPTQVAGVTALTFDVRAGDGSVSDGASSREVLFVREGFAWRVQGADTAEGFESTTAVMEQMLATWEFV